MLRVLRDVVFAERTGFRPLTLDLHLPVGEPSAVVVFVHGGGWRLGSRRVFTPGVGTDASFGAIVGAGIAVAAIDYRLSGEAVFPAPVDDVAAAVQWIASAGAEHALAPRRVVLWGESAGAHLAALASFRPDVQVAGVVDWFGPSDLTALGRALHPHDPDVFDLDPQTREAGLLGGPPGLLPEVAALASPALQVPEGPPPFLIAHGLADDLVPFSQSAALAEALRENGGAVELVPVEGAGHFWRGAADVPALFAQGVEFVSRVTG